MVLNDPQTWEARHPDQLDRRVRALESDPNNVPERLSTLERELNRVEQTVDIALLPEEERGPAITAKQERERLLAEQRAREEKKKKYELLYVLPLFFMMMAALLGLFIWAASSSTRSADRLHRRSLSIGSPPDHPSFVGGDPCQFLPDTQIPFGSTPCRVHPRWLPGNGNIRR